MGATLDLEAQVLLRLNELLGPPPPHHLEVSRARAENERSAALVRAPVISLPVADRAIEVGGRSLPIRVYTPRETAPPRPILVYFHGGCWIFGSLETHDGFCRRIARDAGVIVVAVDYRLAPEAPYPGPLDDAQAAFEWVVAHAGELGGDPARVSVAGDSAGGNLAAALCIRQKRLGGRQPHAQILIYPALELTRSLPSHGRFASGYLLDEGTMDWAVRTYAPRGGLKADEVSPVFASDLEGLPAAVIVTAGFDPLRDEGRLYAERLEQASVPVRYRCETTLVHGFVSMDLLSSCAHARDRLIEDVRAVAAAERPLAGLGAGLDHANVRQ